MFKLPAAAFALILLLQAPLAIAASLDAMLAAQFKTDAPGVAVIVTREGKTVLRKAYGLAQTDGKKKMAPDAVLRLGSITKQVTAIGILMLADEGKLALSDDIRRYLPGYPAGSAIVTIEHLLTHSSGIVDYTRKPDFGDVAGKDVSVSQAIDYFKEGPLAFAPGSQFVYNNSGYYLLGAIIEKVSGMPYARFVDVRIAQPLGLRRFGYEGTHPRLLPVPGYIHQNGGVRPAQALSMSWPYSSGALVGTVDDLARWQHALASGKLVRPATLKRAWSAYRLGDGKTGPYGYGWFVGTLKGSPMIHHGGDINGFHSEAVWLPNERIYVAMLANAERAGSADLFKLTRQLALQVAGKPVPVPNGVKLGAEALSAYAGVYPINAAASHKVRSQDGGLTIQGTGMPRAPLHPYAPDSFLIGDSMLTVEFARDAKGIVERMTITDDNGAQVHRRAQDRVEDRPVVEVAAAVLEQYRGRYALAPGFVMEVSLAGAGLRVGPAGQPSVEAAAIGQNLFHVADNDAELRFEKQADGGMLLVLTQGPAKLRALRQVP